MAEHAEPELFDFQSCLDEDEQILWMGKPDPAPNLGPFTEFFAVVFLFLGLLVVWIVLSGRMPDLLLLIGGLVFLAFGLFLGFGIEPFARRRREAVSYAVTDRRLLRADRGRTEVRGLNLANVVGVELVHGILHSSLRFRVAGDSRDWAEHDGFVEPIESPMPMFLDIADADAVAGLIERARKNAPVGDVLPSAGDDDAWFRFGRALRRKGKW